MESISLKGLSTASCEKQPQAVEPQPQPQAQSKAITTKLPKLPRQVNEEDVKKHQDHVIMLSRYGSSVRFGSYLKEDCGFDLSVKKLKKMKCEDLEELLVRVRSSVGSKNVSDIWSESILGGVTVVESVVVASPIGNTLKIEGLSEELQNDDTFLDLLEELRLENQNLAYVSTETRLAYCALSAAAKVHAMNTIKHRFQEKKEEEPPKEITTKQQRYVPPSERVIELKEKTNSNQ